MKPKLTIYVTDAELAQFRREAERRRLSLSRYLKERFLPTDFERAPDRAALVPETEKRLADAVRRAADAHSRKMLDQLAARTLGEAHHGDWQHQVEALVRELRGDAEPAPNGAHA